MMGVHELAHNLLHELGHVPCICFEVEQPVLQLQTLKQEYLIHVKHICDADCVLQQPLLRKVAGLVETHQGS